MPSRSAAGGWRGPDGQKEGRGEPNPAQLERYIENGCFWHEELAPELQYFKHANRAYLIYAAERGFLSQATNITLRLYSEVLQKFRLAARGHGERPMAMYHSWGSQNAWLRQIHGDNRLYISRAVAEAHDLADDDWAWLESRNGRIKAQVRIQDGLNPKTLWTWNAIGKRAGAWHLAADAGEAKTGFLLNHLIDELLPERESGYRYACADPVTGQAAWYDLRVRIEKAAPAEAGETMPQFAALPPLPGSQETAEVLRYGADFHEATGDGRSKRGRS